MFETSVEPFFDSIDQERTLCRGTKGPRVGWNLLGTMKLARRKFVHLAAGAAALPVMSRMARAQAYPSRPITMIVPIAAGSSSDVGGALWPVSNLLNVSKKEV